MPFSEARTQKALDYLKGVFIVAVCTVISIPLRTRFEITNFAMLYLFSVLVASVTCRRGAAIVSALLTVTAFYYFMIPIYDSFVINDYTYLVTIGTMLAVALVTTTLIERV